MSQDELAAQRYICDLQEGGLASRWRAAEKLGDIAQPGSEAVPALIQALQETGGKRSSGYLRWTAAESLGKIGDPSAVSALIQALQDEDQIIRWQCAKALGRIGAPSAVPVLVALLEREEIASVRWYGVEALSEICSPENVPAQIQAMAVPALIQMMNDDPDYHNRGEAAFALGQWCEVIREREEHF
jgi:HEAT repeat protein